jgi:arylsulfatase A-like enzyme
MMKWKGHIKEGQKYEYPVITLDILPTSLALAGGNPENIKELDGVNLLPFISGGGEIETA